MTRKATRTDQAFLLLLQENRELRADNDALRAQAKQDQGYKELIHRMVTVAPKPEAKRAMERQ